MCMWEQNDSKQPLRVHRRPPFLASAHKSDQMATSGHLQSLTVFGHFAVTVVVSNPFQSRLTAG